MAPRSVGVHGRMLHVPDYRHLLEQRKRNFGLLEEFVECMANNGADVCGQVGTNWVHASGTTPDDIRTFYGLMVGREISRDEIVDYGWEILDAEWEFNRRAGFTEADDVLPECMRTDAVGPRDEVFDVSADVIAAVKVRKPLGDDFFETKPA